MKFDSLYQPYQSNRITISARNGVVATSNALASQAGLDMLKQGGNAVDAAIATAACLTVVEPTANGIGSDSFALVWMKDKVHGLNSNGPSPQLITLNEVKKNHKKMPTFGWTPVTVPGAPKAWAALNEKFGKLSLLQCLMPAIKYAEEGFPVAANVSYMWKRAFERYKELFEGKEEYDEWFKTFTFDGKPPEPFQVITLKNHGKTLREIGESQGKSFYQGALADAMEKDAILHKGYLRKKDLENFEPDFVEPISVNYRDYQVVELPPSGQGMVALMALNMLSNFKVSQKDEVYYHQCFEAMKIAFADGMHHITDPKMMRFKPEDFLSKSYGKIRAKEITEKAKIYSPKDPYHSGTVYLCTADNEGNMVSMIQSNYMGFGSGIVVKDTGISLQNRGADFSLDENHDNVLAPEKKTYHTIIPAMLMKEGKCEGVFGVMGGYMQPQGHVQVVSNLLDFSLNPQMALDCPRWQWVKGKSFLVEKTFDEKIIHELRLRGHEVSVSEDTSIFGRGQMILKLPGQVYVAATESRTDGNIALY